jgi:hypothetical protein
MAVPLPCPQCGKSLKLSDSVLGKTIRCPGCQATFKAPSAAAVAPPAAPPGTAPDDLPEVLPVTAADQAAEEPPVLAAVADDRDAGPPRPRSRRPEDRGPSRPGGRRKGPAAKKGWGAGAIVAILGVALLACGGIGTLGFFAFKGVIEAAKDAGIPDSAWQTYRPAGARCTVSLPGTPTPSAITAEPGVNGGGKEYLLNLNRHNRNFSFTVADLSKARLRGWEPNPLTGLADSERDYRTHSAAGNRLVEDTPTTHSGLAARAFRIDTRSSGSIAVLVVLRAWADGSGTLVTLRVEGWNVRPDSPEVVRYFESLQFEPDTTTPAPEPSPEPRDLNEALAWLTANDPANRKKAAEWLDRQGVVEGRRAEVAGALQAALARNTDAPTGNILRRDLAKWRP